MDKMQVTAVRARALDLAVKAMKLLDFDEPLPLLREINITGWDQRHPYVDVVFWINRDPKQSLTIKLGLIPVQNDWISSGWCECHDYLGNSWQLNVSGTEVHSF